jgi:hypothetical protein|tara:strand:+ start:2989 stop:3921 length:933 start_codon:yes stop_codon:yes gene_type:complete
MSIKVPSIDQSCLSTSTKSKLGKLTPEELVELKLSGVWGDQPIDQSALYIKADYEEIVGGSSNENNAYIVIGRDRHSGRASGYGGQGDTQCGSIDLVVGRNPCREVNFDKYFVNPDFKKDAARIYISQKTNIDDYFGLKLRPRSKAVSGIGIKADEVRIMSRQTIKLVTGMDGFNSRNGKLETVGGIHLIAGNTTEGRGSLEPLVKGDKLAEMVAHLLTLIEAANTILHTWTRHQTVINKAIANHTHPSPLMAKPTFPSLEALMVVPQKMLEQTKDTAVDVEAYYNAINNFKTLWLAQDRPFLSMKNKTN